MVRWGYGMPGRAMYTSGGEHMKTISATLICIAACTAQAGVFQTVTVDFDDQPGGFAPPIETDGLFSSDVTFSTDAGNILMIFSGAGVVGGSPPNTLTAGESTSTSVFDGDIYMDFPVAAQSVSLDILSDNDSGVIASLNVIHSGGSTLMDVVGDGDFTTAIGMDLSAFSDVTRIELFGITDEFGLSIDNLIFNVPIPAPGSLALFGIGSIAAVRRRR